MPLGTSISKLLERFDDCVVSGTDSDQHLAQSLQIMKSKPEALLRRGLCWTLHYPWISEGLPLIAPGSSRSVFLLIHYNIDKQSPEAESLLCGKVCADAFIQSNRCTIILPKRPLGNGHLEK